MDELILLSTNFNAKSLSEQFSILQQIQQFLLNNEPNIHVLREFFRSEKFTIHLIDTISLELSEEVVRIFLICFEHSYYPLDIVKPEMLFHYFDSFSILTRKRILKNFIRILTNPPFNVLVLKKIQLSVSELLLSFDHEISNSALLIISKLCEYKITFKPIVIQNIMAALSISQNQIHQSNIVNILASVFTIESNFELLQHHISIDFCKLYYSEEASVDDQTLKLNLIKLLDVLLQVASTKPVKDIEFLLKKIAPLLMDEELKSFLTNKNYWNSISDSVSQLGIISTDDSMISNSI
jgi:hypothetical protein